MDGIKGTVVTNVEYFDEKLAHYWIGASTILCGTGMIMEQGKNGRAKIFE